MLRPETTLNPGALRREAIQLAVLAVASLAVLLFAGRVLQLIAGIVDAFILALTTIAWIVAWRVGGRGTSLLLYVIAPLVFLALALTNLAGV